MKNNNILTSSWNDDVGHKLAEDVHNAGVMVDNACNYMQGTINSVRSSLGDELSYSSRADEINAIVYDVNSVINGLDK